jgi:hypothetical protein
MTNPAKIFLLSILILLVSVTAYGQSIKVVAGSTLVGASNGALIGLGVMGLNNDADLTPLRIGVGVGTLYGIGMGIYDISEMGTSNDFYQVEGIFNTTDYSSLIVLLDTFYGGVAGSVVGVAVSLIVNSPLRDGIRVGGGVGIIGGFAFGLLDAFTFSHKTGIFDPNIASSRLAPGLVNFIGSDNINMGLINPAFATTPVKNKGTGHYQSFTSQTLELANLRIYF